MIKWLVIGATVLIVLVVAIRILKVMLHTEKASKPIDKDEPEEEYIPIKEDEVDLAPPQIPNEIENLSNGFGDSLDDEFSDYSKYAHNRKPSAPIDFDLEGDYADDEFEYIPNRPDLDFFPQRRVKKKQKPTIEQSLNDMPTELKVLMLSDIFDRKFF